MICTKNICSKFGDCSDDCVFNLVEKIRRSLDHGSDCQKAWQGRTGENVLRYKLIELGHEVFTATEVHPDGLPWSLKHAGAKRPDLYVLLDDGMILLDAKFHRVGASREFWLRQSELDKYDALLEFCREAYPDAKVHLAFYVIPVEECCRRGVYIPLSRMNRSPRSRRDIGDEERVPIRAIRLADLKYDWWDVHDPSTVRQALEAEPLRPS